MFYITSQLRLDDAVRKGSRFKKGQILAYDPSFFGKEQGSIAYKSGVLTRTAIVATDQTYEDSVMVSRKLVGETVSEITITREVSLSARANLQKVAKVGDAVSPNTPLAVFENLPEDTGSGEILSRIGKEFDQMISELATNVARAKQEGEVVEVKVYYNRPVEELSESIQAYIRKMARSAEARKKALAGAPSDEPIRVTEPEFVEGDKVLGRPINGILIIFFIRTLNEAGPGDKVTLSATKGIIARVFEEGEEPQTEDERSVDFIMSPLSTVSRMTNDVFMALWTNSVLIALKEKVAKIVSEPD